MLFRNARENRWDLPMFGVAIVLLLTACGYREIHDIEVESIEMREALRSAYCLDSKQSGPLTFYPNDRSGAKYRVFTPFRDIVSRCSKSNIINIPRLKIENAIASEVPDFGKSKIRLSANLRLYFPGGGEICESERRVMGYSSWYEISLFPLSDFRPPAIENSPDRAANEAWEEFVKEVHGFVANCVDNHENTLKSRNQN